MTSIRDAQCSITLARRVGGADYDSPQAVAAVRRRCQQQGRGRFLHIVTHQAYLRHRPSPTNIKTTTVGIVSESKNRYRQYQHSEQDRDNNPPHERPPTQAVDRSSNPIANIPL